MPVAWILISEAALWSQRFPSPTCAWTFSIIDSQEVYDVVWRTLAPLLSHNYKAELSQSKKTFESQL